MKCPYCDSVGVGENDEKPEDGTLLLCINCAGFYVVTDGSAVKLTAELASDIFTDEDIRSAAAKKKQLMEYAAFSGWKTLYTEPMLAMHAERLQPIEE